MTIKEFKERNFKLDFGGKVIDDMGNEYRNEKGEVEFLEEHIIVPLYYLVDKKGNPVVDEDSMTEEFETKLENILKE